jgi:hypothetical protein
MGNQAEQTSKELGKDNKEEKNEEYILSSDVIHPDPGCLDVWVHSFR